MKNTLIAALILLGMILNVGASVNIASCQYLTSAGQTYLLTADVQYLTASCFTINANNIILDCQNHVIEPYVAHFIGSTGISITPNMAQNVTIRNCVIKSSRDGIRYQYSGSGTPNFQGVRIEDNTFIDILENALYVRTNYGLTDVNIERNYIKTTTGAGYCIYTYYLNTTADRGTIKQNTFDTCRRQIVAGVVSENLFQGNGSAADQFYSSSIRYASLSNNITRDGNYWLIPPLNYSQYCSTADLVHCDIPYDVPQLAGQHITDYYPLTYNNSATPAEADEMNCGTYPLCLTFRDNTTKELITDGEVAATFTNLGTHDTFTYYTDSAGRVRKNSGYTEGIYTIDVTHPKYRFYHYPGFFNDWSTGATPLHATIYLIPVFDLTDLTAYFYELRDADNLTRNLSGMITIEAVYDLDRCRLFYAAQPACCIDAALNTHGTYTTGIYNNFSIPSPKGCTKLTIGGSGGTGTFGFLDYATGKSTNSIEACSCSTVTMLKTQYVVEDDPYVEITGKLLACATWACVNANAWAAINGATVTASGESGYFATTTTNATGGFKFVDVKKNAYYMISWALTGYESGSRRDYIGDADKHYAQLYMNPIANMPALNFSVWGYVKALEENGTLAGVGGVDIFGVYSTMSGGALTSAHLTAYTQPNGYYNISFSTNRYPQPVIFDYNTKSFMDVYDSPSKTVTITNSSSGRRIRADITLTPQTFLWKLIVPIDPGGCDPALDPACIIPSAEIICMTFNGTSCTNRSWSGTGGVVNIPGLDCGVYSFRVESDYAEAQIFTYTVPCSKGAFYIINGTVIIPPVIVVPTVKVAYITVNTLKNWSPGDANQFIAGASVQLCNASGSCETKATGGSGNVKFLKPEGTYSIIARAPGYNPCVISQVGEACLSSPVLVTTPPSQFLFLRFVKQTQENDIWAWLASMNVIGVVQIFFLLAVCLSLIKIVREFGG